MTPWELVKKSEHSHQRAVFAWANCVAMYGFEVAADPRGYSLGERHSIPAYHNSLPVPELGRLFAVHNQGHGDKIRGAHARAEGVKPGVPDIILPVVRYRGFDYVKPCPGLFIEMKRPKLGKTAESVAIAAGVKSQAQDDWGDFLKGQGYQVEVAVGWLEAVNLISAYMGSKVVVS